MEVSTVGVAPPSDVHSLDWAAAAPALEAHNGLPITAEELTAFHTNARAPHGCVLRWDVAYGRVPETDRSLKLILGSPLTPGPSLPAVVFLHGGGWRGGRPEEHLQNVRDMAACGFVAISDAYRLSDEAPFPAALEDAKSAVRWLRASADDLHIDPRRIAVAGSSAGAHLAAMVALTPGRWEGDAGHGDQSSEVQAAVLWYGGMDLRGPLEAFPEARELIKALLGNDDENRIVEASPTSYVSPSGPPMLTFIGDRDRAIPLPMLRAFHDALDDAEVANDLVVFEDRGHCFNFYPHHHADCHARMVAFLTKHL